MLQDAFGCAVANRFGNLLDDEADPFDLISEVELEKKKINKKEDDKKGKQKKPGQKESQRNRRLPVASGGLDLVPGGRQKECPPLVTEGRDGRSEAQRNVKRGGAADQRKLKQENQLEVSIPNSRGESRGRSGARGGGYSRNSDNLYLRGKREYDRHDGTGIFPEEKRGGRGPWNWGSPVEPGSEMMEVMTDDGVKTEEPQSTLEDENPNQTMNEENEVVVQVAMEMTLDEWKAMQEVNRPKAEFNIRKAEDKIPSKAKVIHQSKYLENTRETVEELEEEGNFFRRSMNDITTLLDINFGTLGRPSRGGRGRGARGGQSIRPERARPIYERKDEMAPNPDDPEDFPALTGGR
ncbi:intracellular hyaluronan-binding protein 4-like isoform X2 [Girardinichthys multiradiatus]|uniref:intracellular hyaluronan-binding protein 4-like isoform X2 n=1 Tax=Girardinichthys multiradiatus TaxID=208333 RepID=UPI001FAB7796|nr:intracellular hyaluronan-binding protein 4-like isoform X2 [Girardinichthys multiradiatus]